MENLNRILLTFLINALWQAPLVAAAASLAAWLLRRAPARYRHGLWVMALALGALLPLASSLRAPSVKIQGEVPVAASEAVRSVPALPTGMSSAGRGAGSLASPASHSVFLKFQQLIKTWKKTIPVAPWAAWAVVACYLVLLAARWVRLGRAWRKTNTIRRSACRCDLTPETVSVVDRCRSVLNVHDVTVLCSPDVAGPLTLGARRPTIILPATFVQAATPDELVSALSHELAHVRRRDFLSNLLCELVYLPLSFHPAAALIRRRIGEARELACDELAAGQLVSAATYARSLVSLARAMALPRAAVPFPEAGCVLGVFDANILEERIMRLLDNRPRIGARRARLWFAAALLVLGLSGLAFTTFSFGVAMQAPSAKVTAVPDFSGLWELDKAKSDLPAPHPEILKQVIHQQGNRITIRTSSDDLNPQQPIAVTLFALTVPEFEVIADNVERSQDFGPGHLKSRTRWDDGRLVTDWRLEREGTALMVGSWARSVSADGRSQTVEIQARDPKAGTEGAAKLVLSKTSQIVRGVVSGGAMGGIIQGVPGGVKGGIKGGAIGGVNGGVVGRVEGAAETGPSASIKGIVVDPSGARVPIAVVSVVNQETGKGQTVSADAAGEFSFPELPSGRYSLKVRSPGFETYQGEMEMNPSGEVEFHGQKYVFDSSGTLRRLTIPLDVGSVMEDVEVKAKAPEGSTTEHAAGTPQRIRVGGNVQATKLVEHVPPAYPESARQKGEEGNVVLQAVISMEGKPIGLSVLSSPDPALSDAAVEAVKQWRYEPTLLNGQPIEVVTMITVRFVLSRE